MAPPRPRLKRPGLVTANTLLRAATSSLGARVAIEAVAALARRKSLNVAQKYARKADQLKRAPSMNPALSI